MSYRKVLYKKSPPAAYRDKERIVIIDGIIVEHICLAIVRKIKLVAKEKADHEKDRVDKKVSCPVFCNKPVFYIHQIFPHYHTQNKPTNYITDVIRGCGNDV